MKNIAIMVTRLYGGGAERIAGLLSKYLSRKYSVYLFLEDTEKIVYEHGGTILDVQANGEENVLATIREYKEKYDIHCSISFLNRMNLRNIYTRGTELVVISERNANGENVPYSYGAEARIKRWYPYADKVVAVSYGVGYDLAEKYGVSEEKIATIYNFIDTCDIREKSFEMVGGEVEDFVGESRLLLHVGRLEPPKNQKKLICQFAKLIEWGLDVKLLMIGSGALEQELVKQIGSLGIEDRVKLLPYCKNPFPYYRMASMMVLSSNYEGLPNVVLEAMTLGLPVAATDCLAGPRELLSGSRDYGSRTSGVEECQRGILAELAATDETGETDYLARAMALLLKDDALRQRIAQNECSYMSTYSNEVIYGQWVDIIENSSCSGNPTPLRSMPEIEGYRKVIVFGAGMYGREAMAYLKEKAGDLDLLCFAVSDGRRREETVMGIPVYEISELTEHVNDSIVVICVYDTNEYEVRERLEELGFQYTYLSI